MRIAINGLFLQQLQSGIGRYVYNLLGALGRHDNLNSYSVLTLRAPSELPKLPNSFTFQTLPAEHLGKGSEELIRFVWGQHTFPLAARRQGAHVAHVPHFAPPWCTYGVPTIVTVHDVIPLRLPEYRASRGRQAYVQFISHAIKRAAAIITVSEFSKREIQDTLGIDDKRIQVIQEAADPRFRPAGEADQRVARTRYGLGERYILNVGGMDARKNIAALVKAFAILYRSLGDRDLQLCIAGDPARLGSSPVFPDWRPLAHNLGVTDHIICAPVAEDDLPSIYSAAACFVFTSVYEGFGLTPLEAMASGVPVVCSNGTALPEVAGSAASLIDPRDPEAIAFAAQQVLESDELARRMREHGLARARNFTWDTAAAETSALYARISGR